MDHNGAWGTHVSEGPVDGLVKAGDGGRGAHG
jgi:hypothetical protein